jgi:alkaline phosphatase D
MKKKVLVVIAGVALMFFSCKKERQNTGAIRYSEAVAALYDSSLKPFYHGVASGDPLPDRVILWTRVTPEDSVSYVPVTWEIAEDSGFRSIYKTDTTRALASRDYTVKIDADALIPDHIYYYRFSALGKKSIVGRTKTSPIGAKDSLKFAIATCANWEWGYFNAYARIADREILDAVIHLGDYIYEYGTGKYGDTTIGRINIPRHEVVSLHDYRTRYSQYRLDKGLRRIHQQHPFIAIWDDHEIANNSYTAGAQNHQPDEGDYSVRKAAAKRAYYEWLPIREEKNLYRSFSFGNLADLVMLDERLAGKTKPVDSIQDPTYGSDQRSMLGPEQLGWLEKQLSGSKATWKIIGNQVLFSDLDLSSVYPKMPRNLDSWDGYPAEKKKLKDFIASHKLSDVIFVTGDTHASWAIEAATDIKKTYAPFAIELGTTSISSANDDEHMSADKVKLMEAGLLKINPHVKYVNDRDHGYLLLTLFSERARAEWYYVNTLRKPDSGEFLGKSFLITKGSTLLK